MPRPLLKVRSISSRETRPIFWIKSNTGGTGQRCRLIQARRPSGKILGRLPGIPPPVIWAAPLIECFANRSRVNLRRKSVSALTTPRPSSSPAPAPLMQFQPTRLKQDLSRQRITVTMKTTGRKPDQNISRDNRLGVENYSSFRRLRRQNQPDHIHRRENHRDAQQSRPRSIHSPPDDSPPQCPRQPLQRHRRQACRRQSSPRRKAARRFE